MIEPTIERSKILLVDDRPDNLLSMHAVLDLPEYELVCAASGEEALDRVLRDEFAVILLDVAMPKMDGFETAALIKERERSRQTPIIFVSASVNDLDHVFQGYSIGAVDYLSKPIDPHALRAKVAVFAQLHRQARRIERQAAQLDESHRRERLLLSEQAERERAASQKARVALGVSEARYQRLRDSGLIAVMFWEHPGGLITDANQAFLDMVGYGRDELLGGEVQMNDLGSPHTREADSSARGELAARGVFRAYEKEFVTRDGVRVTALFGGAWADPSQSTVIGFALDVSDRKQAENERARLVKELQSAVRARDDFLSIAAHELKTPLTPLRMQAQSLLRAQRRSAEPLGRDRLEGSLSVIERSVSRLEQLIDHLLDVSRITVGRLRLDLEELDLTAAMKHVLARIEGSLGQAHCPVELSAEAEVWGRWDALRIEQVMENVILNAAKYGAGQPIEIVVSGGEHGAWFEVTDHGIGMPEGELERIFDKFERLAPLSNYGGFGLGLWIVRQIVEAHGGRIDVWSQPGQGSRFTVQLPRRPIGERLGRAGAGPFGTQPGDSPAAT
jgi:PAS domain S-box-containing protein